MATIIRQGQSSLDVCVQHTGSLENLFDAVLLQNDLSITDDLEPGSYLEVTPQTNRVTKYFTDNKLYPATAE